MHVQDDSTNLPDWSNVFSTKTLFLERTAESFALIGQQPPRTFHGLRTQSLPPSPRLTPVLLRRTLPNTRHLHRLQMKRSHNSMDSPQTRAPSSATSRRQEPVSCQFCRTKKLKCSRESPCSNCISRNLECVGVQATSRVATAATFVPTVRHISVSRYIGIS